MTCPCSFRSRGMKHTRTLVSLPWTNLTLRICSKGNCLRMRLWTVSLRSCLRPASTTILRREYRRRLIFLVTRKEVELPEISTFSVGTSAAPPTSVAASRTMLFLRLEIPPTNSSAAFGLFSLRVPLAIRVRGSSIVMEESWVVEPVAESPESGIDAEPISMSEPKGPLSMTMNSTLPVKSSTSLYVKLSDQMGFMEFLIILVDCISCLKITLTNGLDLLPAFILANPRAQSTVTRREPGAFMDSACWRTYARLIALHFSYSVQPMFIILLSHRWRRKMGIIRFERRNGPT
mmetsp:Transcript_47304/g.99018  ORF Transcript_47304/g.99018 Transcript_47304/m.99018 type:complete len:291 (-) Transcript_47304:374-1246(-)